MMIESIECSDDISDYIKTRVKTVALAKLTNLSYAQSMLENFFNEPLSEYPQETRPFSIKRVGINPKSSSKNLIVNEDDSYIENIDALFDIAYYTRLPTYMLLDSHYNPYTHISCERYAILIYIDGDHPISGEDLIREGFIRHSKEEDCYILPLDPSEIGYCAISPWMEEFVHESEYDRDFSVILKLLNTESADADPTYFSINMTYYSSEGYHVNVVSRVTPEVREITFFS
jgi:hypothetical protein